MIDVERMLMSPIAMQEKWRDTINSSQGEPLHVPINAERYMLASKLNFVSNFENVWDIALIETTSERFATVSVQDGRGLSGQGGGPGGLFLAPQRLFRLIQAHDPGRLVPGQPARPGTLAAGSPAPRRAAGLRVS